MNKLVALGALRDTTAQDAVDYLRRLKESPDVSRVKLIIDYLCTNQMKNLRVSFSKEALIPFWSGTNWSWHMTAECFYIDRPLDEILTTRVNLKGSKLEQSCLTQKQYLKKVGIDDGYTLSELINAWNTAVSGISPTM